ncbi:putative receptor-like serine/threonine-protein kinase, partial [Mucuna pruriens]
MLQLIGVCIDPPQCMWVVPEYLSTMLKKWLHGPTNRYRERMVPLPPFKDRVLHALEIGQAMQYLHEQKPKLICRDLKPNDIFLNNALHVRVANFGHVCFLGDEEMALMDKNLKARKYIFFQLGDLPLCMRSVHVIVIKSSSILLLHIHNAMENPQIKVSKGFWLPTRKLKDTSEAIDQ